MKGSVIAGITVLLALSTGHSASAFVNNTVVYKVSVTIPEHVQADANTPPPPQVSDQEAKNNPEMTTEEVIRNHERVILKTLVTK